MGRHAHRQEGGHRPGRAADVSAWRVYGRTEYAEPLTERGRIEAESAEAASEISLAAYPAAWVELVLVPEQGMHWIIGPSDVEVNAS